jgi:hypothetical protein
VIEKITVLYIVLGDFLVSNFLFSITRQIFSTKSEIIFVIIAVVIRNFNAVVYAMPFLIGWRQQFAGTNYRFV